MGVATVTPGGGMGQPPGPTATAPTGPPDGLARLPEAAARSDRSACVPKRFRLCCASMAWWMPDVAYRDSALAFCSFQPGSRSSTIEGVGG